MPFRPAGWDNEKKISILYENLHTMQADDYYTDVIVKPQTLRKVSFIFFFSSPCATLCAFLPIHKA